MTRHLHWPKQPVNARSLGPAGLRHPMLKWLFRRKAARQAAPAIYQNLVAAARSPFLYRDCGVPDSIEGRYEMIVLHATLLLRRLHQEGREQAPLGQAIVDYLASDLDRSMRELGVGDLSVSRYMKRLGEGLYGRAAAYEAALADPADPASLPKTLLRNVYGDIHPGDRILAAIAAYVRDQARRLAHVPIPDIQRGAAFVSPVGDNP